METVNILVAFRLVLPFRERKDFVRLSENKLNSIVFTTDKIISLFKISACGFYSISFSFYATNNETTLTGNCYTKNNAI